MNMRLCLTLGAAALFLGWAVLPLPHSEMFPGVVVPLNQQDIYSPADALVRQIYVHRGDMVTTGQLLAKLESPETIYKINSLEADAQIAQKQLDLLSDSDAQRSYIPSKEAELSSIQEKLEGLKDQREELTLKAKISGKLFEWNDNLRVGLAIPKDSILGKIADPKDIEAVFFVPEESLDVIKEGVSVKFFIFSTGEEIPGIVTKINPIRPQHLEYPALASLYKGDVAVSQETADGKLKIIEAYYTVHVRLDAGYAQPPFGKSGEVEVRGPWRSKLMTMIYSIMRILWREGSL